MRDQDFLANIQQIEAEVESSLEDQRDKYISSRIEDIRTRVLARATETFVSNKIGGTPLDVAERISELEAQSKTDLESNPAWYTPFSEGLKTMLGVEGAKMPEFKPGMSRKEILWQVAQEAIDNPRYKDIVQQNEEGAQGSRAYLANILQQVNNFETRVSMIKGRMLELQRDGMTIDEAFDQANKEIPKTATDPYEPSTIGKLALHWKQGEFFSGLLDLAKDPWVWAPAIVAAPFSTAITIKNAGMAAKFLANPFSKAGAAAVFSDISLSAAFMPLESLTQDELIEHPGWALATSFGMWGGAFGPMVDTLAADLVKQSPNLSKAYAKKYAENYIATQLRKGRVHANVAKTLDPILSDVLTKAEALAKFDGVSIKQFTDAELKGRGLEINAAALKAAESLADKAKESVKTRQQAVLIKEQEWQAAEKAVEQARKANASHPLVSKLQREAALAKQVWLNAKGELSSAENEFYRNLNDVERLKNVTDFAKPSPKEDVPLESLVNSKNNTVNTEAIVARVRSLIGGRALDKEEEEGLKTWLNAFTNAKRGLNEPITEQELEEALQELAKRYKNAS